MASQRVCEELAESVLDAAGSLFQLEEELDRISLHRDSDGASSDDPNRRHRHRHRKRSKSHKKKSTLAEKAAANERKRKEEDSSAQDTVSFQSSDSLDHSFSASSSSRYDSAIGSLHSQTDNDSLSSHHTTSTPAAERPPPLSPPLTLNLNASISSSAVRTATVEHYYSPQPSLATLIIAPDPANESLNPTHQEDGADANQLTVMGAQVQLRQKKQRQERHNPLTADDAQKHFQWLEQESKLGISLEGGQELPPQQKMNNEMESEGSSSTVIAEGEIERLRREGLQDEYMIDMESDSLTSEDLPLTGEKSLLQRRGGEDDVAAQVNMPQRYQTPSYPRRSIPQRVPPSRTPSILQRLRRKQGSFRRPQQKQRTQVQRSLSDRFVYHLKRKWDTNSEDCPISTPTSPRPIGRLFRTYAGRLHLVQLHRLPDGQFGIYISQRGSGKIFISRFANVTAEKFYAGLLRPGDELVSVNKEKIRGRSMDYVYDLLSRLDSVIVAVVPVTAHRNW